METLFDKESYNCHYSKLKFLIQQGLKVATIRKELQFDQSKFTAIYKDLNIKMRQRPQNSDFDKKFFKHLNKSCFGRTMENLRRRKKVVMVKDEELAVIYCI